MITYWQHLPHVGQWMQISEPQFRNVCACADALLARGNTTLEIKLAMREEPDPAALTAATAAARPEGGPRT